MYLNTTHIVKFSPMDLPTTDVLNSLQKELNAGKVQVSVQLTEGLSKYFSKSLKLTNFAVPFVDGLYIESATLTVFEGGFGAYEVIQKLPEEVTANEVIEITDSLRLHIADHISTAPHMIAISKFFGNWLSDDGAEHYPAQLMWAYSQACIFDTAENFIRFSKELGGEDIRVYDDCRVTFDPTAIVFFFNERDRLDTAVKLVASVTISTSLAYDIQNSAIEISRRILQNPDRQLIFSSIERHVRLINVMDQYLTEIHQDDLIANLNEVVFAKPTAFAFGLTTVVEKAFRAVSRLKVHVETIENELNRRQQRRMNNILMAFTLLSIVGITASVISLYDFANQIHPVIRILILSAALSVAIAFVIFLLKKLSYRN